MLIEQVTSKVFWVEGSHNGFALVVEGDEVTMVDSGFPNDRDLVDASVAEVGRALADIQAVVLTHGHADHKGSAERLRRDHDAVVHCHTDEAALVRGEIEQRISLLELRRAWRPKIFRFAFNAIRSGGLRPAPVEDVSTFNDGETLDVPGRPVSVFTPGHTQGHSSLHLPDEGVLITGDALITVDLWDPDRLGPQLIRRQFNFDHDQAKRSLARLADVDADVLIPGHGKPWRGRPSNAVQQALEA